MITIVVPTFNRSYALELVLDTFYNQKYLSEIIIVDDCSIDSTKEIVEMFSRKYISVRTIYVRNEIRSGAAFSRWKGVELANSPYILFCDDDEFLENNYTDVCLKKIKSGKGEIVSGRHMYRNIDEKIEDAIARFGNGLVHKNPFGFIRYKVYTDAIFINDIYLPFTHGIFLTSKDLLLKIKMDPFYAKGNGFREESDFQLNAHLNGNRVLVTNETHCVHMNMSEVRSGGQRVNRITRFYYNIRYTHYFLKKYFNKVKEKHQLPYGFKTAILAYFISEFYDFFIRPIGLIGRRIVGK